MRINLVGTIFGVTGYDIHTKKLANALYKLNPDIKLDVPLVQNWHTLVNDEELKMLKATPKQSDVTIALMTPPFWRLPLANNTKKFIGFCVWEGSKVPEYWIEYLMDERVDQIWCPSQHTKDAIMKTWDEYETNEEVNPISQKIKIVPHGVDLDIFNQQVKKVVCDSQNDKQLEPRNTTEEDNKDETKTVGVDNQLVDGSPFRFFVNKGWRGGMEDRGGVQYVLKAFGEEFKKGENVELLVKLNPSYINPANVNEEIKKLNLPEEGAKIMIMNSVTSPEKIAELCNESDCYVCATRAEAFDLGTAEAMACGLPIITTNYGGQIEHMDETCADFIDYDLVDVKGDIQYEGIMQAVPDIKHLRTLMRKMFNNKKDTKNKGVNARKFISEKFTWDLTAKKAMNFLEELK